MGSSRRSPGIKSRSGRHQRSPPSADDAHSRKKRRPGSSSSSSSDSESGSDTDQHVSSKKLQMSSSGKRSSDVRSSIKDDKRKKRRDTDSGSSSDDSESSPVKGKTAGSRGGESSRLRELISKRKTAVKNTHGSSSSESESESDAEDRSAAKRPDKKSSVSRTKQLDVRRPTSRKVSPRVSKADSRRKELRKSSSSDSSESESEDDVVPDYSRRKKERSLGRGSGRKGEVPSRNRDKESAPGVMSKSSKSSSSRLVRSEHDHRRRHSSERRNAPRPETTRHSGRREESGSRRRRDQSDSPEEHSSKRIVSRPQHREKLARSDGRREESGSRRRRDLSDSPEGQSPKGRSSRRQTKGSDSERKRDKVSTQARSSGSRGETGSKRRRDHAGSSEDASSKVRSSRRQNRGSGSERKREQASTQARSSGNRGESGSRRRKDSSDSSEGASPEGKSSRQNKGSDPDRKRDKASTQARSSGSRVESGSLRRRVPSYSSEDASPGGKSSRRQNKGSDSERKRDQTSTQARSSGSRGVSGLRRRKDLADSSEDAPPVGRSSHRKSKGSDSERKPDQGSTQACSSGGRIESGSRRRKDLSDTPEGQSSKRKNSRSRNQESGSDRKHGDTSERTLSKREQSHSRDRKEDDVREAKRDESVRDARGSDRPDKLKRDEEQLPSGKVKESSHRPQQGASRKRQSESSSSEDDSRRRRAAGSRKPSKSRHDGSEGRDKRTKDIMHKQKDAVASSKRTSTDDSTSEDESRRDAQSNTRSDRPRQVREPPSEGVKVAGRQQDTLKLRSASSSSSEVETPSAGKRGDRGGETEVSPSRTRPPVQKPVSPEVDPRGLRVLEEPADGVSSPSHRSTGTADGKKDANVEAVAGRQRHDTSESDSSSDVVGVRPAEMKKVTSAEESASDSGAAESHDEDAGIAGRKVDTVRSKVVVSGGSSGLPLPTADEGTEQKKEEHGNATSKEEARKHRSPADGSEKGGGGSVSLTADRPKMRSEIGGRAAVVEDLRQKVGDAAEDEESTSGEDADIVSRSATPLSSPESPEVHHSTGNLGRETMRSTVVVNKPSGDKITGGFAGDGRSDKRRQHPDDGEDDAERRGSKRSGQNTADDSRGSRGRRPGDKKRTSSPGGGDSQKRQRGQRSSPDRQAYWSRAADSDEAAEQRDGGEGGRSPDHYWRREPFQRRPAEERYSDDLKRYAASQGDRKRRRSHEDGEERPRELRSSGAADKDVGVRAAADKTADTMPGGVSAAEMLTTRTGGAYIPPARLRMMQEQITDKSSAAYQRLAWEALKKSLNGLINKVNVSNLVIIVQELLQENVVRGRGLLCRALLQAQAASPTFTHVYAALVAVINTKFPQIGELLLHRLVLQFKRGFRRNDKPNCLAACRFVAHLVNQQVAHEVLALEILTLLLETPTDDSVEVSIGFLQEVGQKLTELSPRGVGAIFERLRHILHEAMLEKRVQYMIEVVFAVRKDGFKSYPSLIEELDVVEEDDQFTHLLALDEVTQSQEMLNVFRLDPDYEANEEKYATIRREVLDDSGGSDDGSGSEEDVSADEGGENDTAPIVDTTESNLLSLRKTIYLTIRSSLDFEETAHKLLKLKLKPGQEPELCHMFLDCCAQERTFEKFYGLLAERFCVLNRKYRDPMEQIFSDTYDTVHRLETSKLRNVAKLFGHLLNSDAISWGVLQHCRLNEEDTNSSSRIFIKILFQELSEFMGLARLNERVNDVHLGPAFEGLFPRDNPKNTRFAINFFTSIGLGGLTDGLRDHLKSQPKPTAVVAPTVGGAAASKDTSNNTSGISTSDVTAPAARRAGPPAASDSSSSSSSSSSSDSSSEPSESSSSDSESDGSERRRQKKKNKKKRSRKSKKSAQPRKKAKSDGKQEADRKEKSLSSRSKHDRPEKHRTNKSSSASRRR